MQFHIIQKVLPYLSVNSAWTIKFHSTERMAAWDDTSPVIMPPNPDQIREVTVLVLGEMGLGKSTFLNTYIANSCQFTGGTMPDCETRKVEVT
jgi:ABC-type branched-subunit amino acid transport system ATPase component